MQIRDFPVALLSRFTPALLAYIISRSNDGSRSVVGRGRVSPPAAANAAAVTSFERYRRQPSPYICTPLRVGFRVRLPALSCNYAAKRGN